MSVVFFVSLLISESLCSFPLFSFILYFLWGHVVAQLVEALRYKPDCRGIESRWSH
jgi:hypothetical protein